MRRLPAQAYHLAEAHQLGKPSAIYTTDNRSCGAICEFVGVLVCSTIIIGALYILILHLTMENMIIFATFCLVPSILLFLLLPLAIQRLVNKNACIYVCAEGLIYQQRHQVWIIRWHEIEYVQAGRTRCVILFKDGHKFAFPRYIGSTQAMGRNIKRKALIWSISHPPSSFIEERQ